jgi:hypothetical protein
MRERENEREKTRGEKEGGWVPIILLISTNKSLLTSSAGV